MRFFELLNTQHVLATIIVTLIFAVLFGVTLSVLPMLGPKTRVSNIKAVQNFVDGIQKANGPFPMIIALIVGRYDSMGDLLYSVLRSFGGNIINLWIHSKPKIKRAFYALGCGSWL